MTFKVITAIYDLEIFEEIPRRITTCGDPFFKVGYLINIK